MPPLMLQIRLCLLYWRPFERPQLIEGLPSETSAGIGPSSTTLYVGNIPMKTSEDELNALFSMQLGYRRMTLRLQKTGPVVLCRV